MPSSDTIDERFDEIVRELRTLPGAPDTLRKRVLELADQEPVVSRSAWSSRFTLRGTGWTLATVAAGFVAVTLGYGVISSAGPAGSSGDQSASGGGGQDAAQTVPVVGTAESRAPEVTRAQKSPPPAPPPPTIEVGSGAALSAPAPSAAAGRARDATTLPPGRRLAHHTASMRLRVSDLGELSRTTREAMRIARSHGGFVATVSYAQPKGDEGDATLILRVPAARIQAVIGQLSDLGVIVSQQIQITDVQNRVNDTTDELARLRRTIRRIEARLEQPISPDQRFRLELQLENARQTLKNRTESRDANVRRARLAVVNLTLTTREAEAQPAAPPGRIERAARNAATLLAKEAAAIVYVLIVLSPLILLAAAAFAASRTHRRRFDQKLLEQA